MELTGDIVLIRNFAIALAIGALVGVERQKHQEQGLRTGAGLRTFILIAQAGAVAAWFAQHLQSPWFLAATVLALVLPFSLLGHGHGNSQSASGQQEDDGLGLTTAVAALTVFLLGAMTMSGQPELAVALGITASAVLAYRDPLHGLVRKMDLDDIYAGLKLLIATFIVLPLLPNRTIDVWAAFNPFQFWSLAILISGLSLVGYMALRWLGPGRGTVLTGLAGGLVSSTAVTLALARRSKDMPAAANMLATGILIAWAVMYLRVIVVLAVVHPTRILPLLLMMGVLALISIACAFRGWRHRPPKSDDAGLPMKNPFSLWSATKFALFFAGILFVVRLTQLFLPNATLYGVAALAGLADVDAIVLTMAKFVHDGGNADAAVRTVLIATWTNTLSKTGMVMVFADAGVRRLIVLPAIALTLASLGLFIVS